MLVTEEEAKGKWCPFVRFASDDGATLNRGDSDPMNLPEKGGDFVPRCIGSGCMAWRWLDIPSVTFSADEINRGLDESMRDNPKYRVTALAGGRVRYTAAAGYCGLSGRPSQVEDAR